jgi:hypothetical protein
MNSIKFDCLAGSRLSEVLTSIRLVNDREKSSRHTSNDITDNGGLTNHLVGTNTDFLFLHPCKELPSSHFSHLNTITLRRNA